MEKALVLQVLLTPIPTRSSLVRCSDSVQDLSDAKTQRGAKGTGLVIRRGQHSG